MTYAYRIRQLRITRGAEARENADEGRSATKGTAALPKPKHEFFR